MIVIATNNGKEYLSKLLDSLVEFGTDGYPILVCDTGTTNQDSLSFLAEIPVKYSSLDVKVERTPYSGYDTGAYIWVFRNHRAKGYFFLQDSVTVKEVGWTKHFTEKASHGVGCVPWLTFAMQWQSQEQIDFVRSAFASNQWPPFGIFGPIFYATHEALTALERKGFLNTIPGSKTEQTAMERGWPTAFTHSGFAVRPVECNFEEEKLRANEYRALNKTFALRA